MKYNEDKILKEIGEYIANTYGEHYSTTKEGMQVQDMLRHLDIDKDSLVIHIRTGDIFYNDWHSLYSQNPLSYYLKISENLVGHLCPTKKKRSLIRLFSCKNIKFSFLENTIVH